MKGKAFGTLTNHGCEWKNRQVAKLGLDIYIFLPDGLSASWSTQLRFIKKPVRIRASNLGVIHIKDAGLVDDV